MTFDGGVRSERSLFDLSDRTYLICVSVRVRISSYAFHLPISTLCAGTFALYRHL
jgi:hypothetical protein